MKVTGSKALALNKDGAEERSLSSNNIGAALSNYSDSFFLLKMLLIFWLHVRFSKISVKGIEKTSKMQPAFNFNVHALNNVSNLIFVLSFLFKQSAGF